MKLICGMHRSGTSLVAKLFYKAGADMGDTATMYPADKWNPGGYFEQTDILAINIPLINGTLGRLAYLCLPSTATLVSRAKRRQSQITMTATRYSKKIVKENRFCLTLPAWVDCGVRVDRIIVCLREPLAIARSLRRRQMLPISFGLRIWRIHMERLLEHTEGIHLWFVRYEQFLDPHRSCSEITAAMHFFGMHLSDAQLHTLCGEIIRPENSTVQASAQRQHCYPVAVRQLWNELLRRYDSQTS